MALLWVERLCRLYSYLWHWCQERLHFPRSNSIQKLFNIMMIAEKSVKNVSTIHNMPKNTLLAYRYLPLSEHGSFTWKHVKNQGGVFLHSNSIKTCMSHSAALVPAIQAVALLMPHRAIPPPSPWKCSHKERIGAVGWEKRGGHVGWTKVHEGTWQKDTIEVYN